MKMVNLIKIWKERGKIAEGIKNNIFKSSHVEQIAFYRQEICNFCNYIDIKGDSCAVRGTQPCCSQCGCCLKLKVRSLSSECPKGFWKAELTQEEEDLLNNKLRENGNNI